MVKDVPKQTKIKRLPRGLCQGRNIPGAVPGSGTPSNTCITCVF